METLQFNLVGTSPLILHNNQAVDPLNKYNKELKLFTGKRKKTHDDILEIARIEWEAGLYYANDAVRLPSVGLKTCMRNAARMTKDGKRVERGVYFSAMDFKLKYSGPNDIEGMWKSGNFTDRRVVKVGQSSIIRTRPIFHEWSFEGEMGILEDILNPEDAILILRQAGNIEGLFDNRVNGYGRFVVEV